MKKFRCPLIFNIILLVCELISLLWMILGIGNEGNVLAISGLLALRYFTVDSNIITFIVSIIVIIDIILAIKNKKEDISNLSYILSLISAVGVSLTMFVTVFFLEPSVAPTMGIFALFMGPNFFLHLVNPILSIITFTLFMKTNKVKFIHTFTSLIPIVIYAIYYSIETFIHIDSNGVIMEGYDWYGFLSFGINYVYIVIPLILLISYGISFGLWKLNRIGIKKNK